MPEMLSVMHYYCTLIIFFSLSSYYPISSAVQFYLDHECSNRPIFIDEGLTLEIRLLSEASSPTRWFPIRYYAPSFNEPVNYTSQVELDSSNVSVTVQQFSNNSRFPLVPVKPSYSAVSYSESAVLIREYICLRYVQNFNENPTFQLRWMQNNFPEQGTSKAEWILDNINIRFWNGTSFLNVFSEHFVGSAASFRHEFKNIELANSCYISPNRHYLVFEDDCDSNDSTSYLTINVTGISLSYEEHGENK